MGSSKQIFLAFAAASLIIALILLGTKHPDTSYNGFTFSKDACPGSTKECWFGEFYIKNNPYVVSFYNHPSEVDDIYVEPDTLRMPSYSNTNHTLYLTVPKNAPGNIAIAAIELGRLLGTANNVFNLNVKAASDSEITCANASKNVIVLKIEQKPVDAVTITSPNCISIGATSDERSIAVADAFAYQLLGVIQQPKNQTNATLPR